MNDLDLIETKARAFIEEAKDLDSLAKAAKIIRDLDEQRKIRAELNAAKQDADRTAERRSEKVRFWTATLLPTLAFLVTAGTFLFQIQQGKVAAQGQEDSQWRTELEKSATDPKLAPVGALEMQSFFGSKRYSDQSRKVAATLLSGIDDPDLFDLVFFDIIDADVRKTTELSHQQDLIALAKALSERLQGLYSDRLAAPGKDLPEDQTLKNFLADPGEFYDHDQLKEENEVDVKEWELDSVSRGLIKLWGTTPPTQNLTGIIFYTTQAPDQPNVDWGVVDFRGAELKNVQFYGTCKIDPTKFDTSEQNKFGCDPPK